MNRAIIIGIAVGAASVAAGTAIASYTVMNRGVHTDVMATRSVSGATRTTHEECRDEQVTKAREPRGKNRIAGSVLGAVVGGVIGNQFGGGKGQDAATAVGVVGGGYAGNQIQEQMHKGNTDHAAPDRAWPTEFSS